MEVIFCKECKNTLSIECFSIRKNGSGYSRYGRICDDCRKKKNKKKHSTKSFKEKNNLKQKKYYHKRFFYKRANTIINNAKVKKEEISFTVNELCKFLATLWKKQKGICVLSGDKLTRENAQVDHIITKKNGGKNDFDNFRWITKESNQIKGPLNDEKLKSFVVKIYNKLTLNQ